MNRVGERHSELGNITKKFDKVIRFSEFGVIYKVYYTDVTESHRISGS